MFFYVRKKNICICYKNSNIAKTIKLQFHIGLELEQDCT